MSTNKQIFFATDKHGFRQREIDEDKCLKYLCVRYPDKPTIPDKLTPAKRELVQPGMLFYPVSSGLFFLDIPLFLCYCSRCVKGEIQRI
jgi:hypothetical protein